MVGQQTKTEIRDAVLEQLKADARVNAEKIQVQVDDGQVTLQGEVPSYRAKWAAAQAAHRVWGVYDVNNEIQVRVPAPTDDQQIATEIRGALMRDSDLDASGIQVEVRGGHVWLRGTVSTNWARIRAEEDARWTRGVVGVSNELSVVPSGQVQDRELAAEVEGALWRDSAVEAKNITVTVAGRHVTLSGVVRNWAERRAALDDALHVPGVSDVRDELAIQYRER